MLPLDQNDSMSRPSGVQRACTKRESPSKTAPIRFLTKDVAIIDVDTELPGMRGSDGKALPIMKFQAAFIAKRVNSEWLFTALRIRTLTTSP